MTIRQYIEENNLTFESVAHDVMSAEWHVHLYDARREDNEERILNSVIDRVENGNIYVR